MANMLRTYFLLITRLFYRAIRPLIFRRSAQDAHDSMLKLLARADNNRLARMTARTVNRIAFRSDPVTVGGVALPHPAILAAGFVKGEGFGTEQDALASGLKRNIIPGWGIMPALVGPVEFGSFTPHPRLGNPGTVVWRDPETQSTQNRIGLRNPGALAASAFLTLRRETLPAVFGINIATSPGVDNITTACDEVNHAFNAFLSRGVYPAWFTLNISCPNTADDPDNTQTEARTRALCETVMSLLREHDSNIPLWVKVSPDLADNQYAILMSVFAETGVRAVVATNTLGMPAPDQPELTAGVGGGKLHPYTLKVARLLVSENRKQGYNIDIIGCGGAMNTPTFHAFREAGVQAVQYWSALVYHGPLAAAYFLNKGYESR